MAIAILAQGKSLELEREQTGADYQVGQRMDKEEQDPLFYDLPLSTLLAWNRCWHLTAKTIVLVYKKKAWGVIGSDLKLKKGAVGLRIARLRIQWAARGRELDYIKQLADS